MKDIKGLQEMNLEELQNVNGGSWWSDFLDIWKRKTNVETNIKSHMFGL